MAASTGTVTNAPETEAVGSVGVGSQTLMRGLDLIEALSSDMLSLSELALRLGLTKSTTHRLATALVERHYLAFTPRTGYRLGPKLLELGFLAHVQADLIQVARPHIEKLAKMTGDTVHLGVLHEDQVLYLDKVPGRRRIQVSSRVGERQPLTSTGLGKALMLDRKPAYWMARLEAETSPRSRTDNAALWHHRMAEYVSAGRAYDLEENEDQIRCVAAPVRDAGGKIVGAISVSSAAQYMDDGRMTELAIDVLACADAISRELGFVREIQPKAT